MIGIDTNVLLRLFVEDDADQAAAAGALVARAGKAGDPLLIDRVVLAEFVTVLERRYGATRAEIALAVDRLLSAAEFALDDADCVEAALLAYRDGAGFVDALIGAANAKRRCATTMTFDRRAARLGTFTLLA